MKTNRKNYREFESDRFVYMTASETPAPASAPSKKQETAKKTDTKKGAAEEAKEATEKTTKKAKEAIEEAKEAQEKAELTEQETEQLTKIVKQFGDNIEEATENEVVLLTELKIKIGDKEKPLGDIIGAAFASNISRYYQIKKGKVEGKIQIAKNGSDDFKEVDAKGLVSYIPTGDREQYSKIVNGKMAKDALTQATESFKKNSETYQNVLASAKTGDVEGVMDSISGGNPENLKGFGIMDLIALFKMVSEALQADPPDLSILADLANDVSHNRSPLKMMKEAKNVYEEEVENTTDAKTLLDYINNPGGKTANEKFPKLKYRTVLKSKARKKLASALGVTVAENGFEQIKGGSVTKITTTGSGVIEIGKTVGGGLSVLRYTIEEVEEEGKKTKEKRTYLEGFEDGKPQSVANNTLTALKTTIDSETETA